MSDDKNKEEKGWIERHPILTAIGGLVLIFLIYLLFMSPICPNNAVTATCIKEGGSIYSLRTNILNNIYIFTLLAIGLLIVWYFAKRMNLFKEKIPIDQIKKEFQEVMAQEFNTWPARRDIEVEERIPGIFIVTWSRNNIIRVFDAAYPEHWRADVRDHPDDYRRTRTRE